MPAIVAHNLAREEVRAALREELALVVAELSKESIGVHLERAGLKEHVRAAVRSRGVPLGRAFLATPVFEAWLASLEAGERSAAR
jgi:hypothetical protein